ncbi:MAG: hypothetical protein V7776_21820 [Halopseudomonas aestusnigri]
MNIKATPYHDDTEYDIHEAAALLRMSTRWLQDKLLNDRRRPPVERRLQHHYFIGRSKRWDAIGFRNLKINIIEQSGASRLSREETGFIYKGPLPSVGKASATERVQGLIQKRLKTGIAQKRS